MNKKVLALLSACLAVSLVIAHPHFSKTVTADMKGTTITLNFTTYPYNEAHLSQVQQGFVFHCGRAKVRLTADAMSGSETIPAGDYVLRAQAESVDDWTLILVPAGQTENSYGVDLSSGIRLASSTLTDQPSVHHLALDLNSGHGDTDGKMVLSVAYGERRIEAVLDLS